MADTVVGKASGLVLRLVQADDVLDVRFGEGVDVILRSEGGVAVDIRDIVRASECDELVGDDPVQIAILDALIELVDVSFECERVEPAELGSGFEALETIDDVAIEHRVDLGSGITEGFEALAGAERLKAGEGGPSLLGRLSECEHLEASHQKSRIRAVTAIVTYLGRLRVITFLNKCLQQI